MLLVIVSLLMRTHKFYSVSPDRRCYIWTTDYVHLFSKILLDKMVKSKFGDNQSVRGRTEELTTMTSSTMLRGLMHVQEGQMLTYVIQAS
jgi:hypothetical protein